MLQKVHYKSSLCLLDPMQISRNSKDVVLEVFISMQIKSFGFENLSSHTVKDLCNFHLDFTPNTPNQIC